MGAVDVIPFVPVRGISMDGCVELARGFGKEIADALDIPVYLYDNADLVALLVNREFADRVDPARPAKLKYVMVVEDDYEAALAAQSPDRLDIERSADDLYIIYTGGTTGMPKGVMWRQEDIFFSGMGGGDPAGQPATKPEQVAEQAKAREPSATFPMAPLWTSSTTRR